MSKYSIDYNTLEVEDGVIPNDIRKHLLSVYNINPIDANMVTTFTYALRGYDKVKFTWTTLEYNTQEGVDIEFITVFTTPYLRQIKVIDTHEITKYKTKKEESVASQYNKWHNIVLIRLQEMLYNGEISVNISKSKAIRNITIQTDKPRMWSKSKSRIDNIIDKFVREYENSEMRLLTPAQLRKIMNQISKEMKLPRYIKIRIINGIKMACREAYLDYLQSLYDNEIQRLEV